MHFKKPVLASPQRLPVEVSADAHGFPGHRLIYFIIFMMSAIIAGSSGEFSCGSGSRSGTGAP